MDNNRLCPDFCAHSLPADCGLFVRLQRSVTSAKVRTAATFHLPSFWRSKLRKESIIEAFSSPCFSNIAIFRTESAVQNQQSILCRQKTKFINGSKTSVLKFHKKHFPPVRLHRTGRKRNSVNKQIAARKFGVAGKIDAKLAETGFISGSRKMRNVHLATG